jgi:large subunit ribosomal protein L6
MSKLAKKSILIPPGTTVERNGEIVEVKGPRGSLSLKMLPWIDLDIENGSIRVSCAEKKKQARANCGTMWALLRNALEGVSKGFQKNLEIEGVGYRVAMEGKTLVLNVGYSHPVRFDPPDGVVIKVEKNFIQVSGIDKEAVGQAAAMIRAIKKPEPYKGKGIRYQGEVIRRKAGKKVAGTTA